MKISGAMALSCTITDHLSTDDSRSIFTIE